MALTSRQKHYIRKNIKNLGPEKVAADLNLDKKTVLEYLKKKLPPKKFENFNRKNFSEKRLPLENFNFPLFFSENLWIFIGLFFLVFGVYANGLGNAFVSDDIGVIPQNPDLGKFSAIFVSHGIGFFQNFLHFLAYHLFGLNPFFYRLPNVIFHLSSTFLVFIILSLITQKRTAFFTAAFFAVHPILIESVTWISGAPYSIYGFFLLLSFLFYLIHSSATDRKKYWAVLFFFFALISSEKAASFPAILFLWELSQEKLKINWKKLIPFFSLSALWVLFFLTKITGRKDSIVNTFYQNPDQSSHPLLQIPVALATYLKLIFWPQKLSLYQTEMKFSIGEYSLCIFILLSFFGLLIYFYQKNKMVFFWLGFFLMALLPTMLSFGLAWIVAERYAYLATLGILAIVAMLFTWLSEKYEEQKNIVYAIFAILILALSIRAVIRNNDWKDEDHLWIATAKVSPSGENIHNNLGDVYSRQGDHEKAIAEFRKAIEINPRYASAYHNLAISQKEVGQIDEAIENYQKALEIDPHIWQSWQNLGVIYFEKGDYPKSAEYLQKALELQPQNEGLKETLKKVKSKI